MTPIGQLARAAVVAAACASAAAPAAARPLSAEARRGRAAMQRAECTRCHDVTDPAGDGRGVSPAPRGRHCVGCHTWILSTRGDADAIARHRHRYPDWDRYLESIEHFTRLPDLGTIARRVRPEFLRAFLDAPFDLRPHLDESMVPVQLSARDKDAVVAYLRELAGDQAVPRGAPAAPEPSAARVAAGRAAFERAGCASCHVVGNERFGADYTPALYAAMKSRALLAPNLRHVRARIPRDVLVRYIADPQAVDPRSTMPRLDLPAGDIEQIADYLLSGDADVPAPPAPLRAGDVAVLDRPVGFDEVYARVFGRICVHCHMNADANGGDGGPGNTGGLGFAGAGLDLETYAGMRRGALRDGRRVSVLDPGPDGSPPLLLQSLLRRHAEAAARDARPVYGDAAIVARPAGDRPGMPLGLPPLPPRDLQLVKTWLAQGAPGPRRAASR